MTTLPNQGSRLPLHEGILSLKFETFETVQVNFFHLLAHAQPVNSQFHTGGTQITLNLSLQVICMRIMNENVNISFEFTVCASLNLQVAFKFWVTVLLVKKKKKIHRHVPDEMTCL